MKKYASKLLLFGEHTVINSSKALAIPYAQYFGTWQQQVTPDVGLLHFANYLEETEAATLFLQTGAFRADVQEGVYFRANIPIGYGLGSSGALCAAVYDRYAIEPIQVDQPKQFLQLRSQLAQMEGFFHGSSSGVDPLICYLQKAVIIDPNTGIDIVQVPPLNQVPFHFFLLDTQISRKTSPFVNIYLEKCKQPGYAALMKDTIAPTVNRAIDQFLAAKWMELGLSMQEISQFQYEYFIEMIPTDFRSVWQMGLDSGAYALKLCGAGGGGFLLGVAFEEQAMQDLSADFSCELIG